MRVEVILQEELTLQLQEFAKRFNCLSLSEQNFVSVLLAGSRK